MNREFVIPQRAVVLSPGQPGRDLDDLAEAQRRAIEFVHADVFSTSFPRADTLRDPPPLP